MAFLCGKNGCSGFPQQCRPLATKCRGHGFLMRWLRLGTSATKTCVCVLEKILGTHCCSIRAYCGARVGLAVIQRICHRDRQAFTWHCNSASARGSWVVSATPCWLKHAVGGNLKAFWLETAMKRVPKKHVGTVAADVDEPACTPRSLKRKLSTTSLGSHEVPTLIPNLSYNY